MLKKLLSLLIFTGWCITAYAQEFSCTVTVLHDKITGVDPQVFTALQHAISDIMNAHKWTTDDYQTTEKIDCKILINLVASKVNGDNDAYSGTISIQATRPVYNSTYNTPTINYEDRDVTFHFSQYTVLQFDDGNITGTDPMASNLTAILGFYAYLIVGLDYDSFAPEGGTVYLKKAQNVVNNAPEMGKTITGWKAVDGTHNRYWIIDQLLNTRFSDVRSYWYTMHREGLDSMYYKPEVARNKILAGLDKLNTVNRENPSSVLIQFFFNAKSDEILHLLASAPKTDRPKYITMLSAMDVANAAKYNSLR